jgi:hypothetical protein
MPYICGQILNPWMPYISGQREYILWHAWFTQWHIPEGKCSQVSYKINRHDYSMGYYLTDGIYPSWETFVKTIPLTPIFGTCQGKKWRGTIEPGKPRIEDKIEELADSRPADMTSANKRIDRLKEETANGNTPRKAWQKRVDVPIHIGYEVSLESLTPAWVISFYGSFIFFRCKQTLL